jgi:hypothetical protein
MTPAEIEQLKIKELSGIHRNNFIYDLVMKMFVNMQASLSDEEFRRVVDDVLGSYSKAQAAGVGEYLKQKPGLETDVEALRIRSHEAIKLVMDKARERMFKLRGGS